MGIVLGLVLGLALLASSSLTSGNGQPPQQPNASITGIGTPFPTVTLPAGPVAKDGVYRNNELGFSFRYPTHWETEAGAEESTLLQLYAPTDRTVAIVFHSPMPPGTTLEQVAEELNAQVVSSLTEVEEVESKSTKIEGDREAHVAQYQGNGTDGDPVQVVVASAARSGRLFTLMVYGQPGGIEGRKADISSMISSMRLEVPIVYGIPREEAFMWLGSESNNPREYDPATGEADSLVFSGLVTFNPQLEVVPDLAESWETGAGGTVYTFHLRKNARFHDRRPVTASDVIYSWERAADPKTDSDTVLTYLGDIVGVREKREGRAEGISGLKALDDHTLQVTIDAPKPYFLMKLAYSVAMIVDRANVESGPEWYRTPNGTGAYKLIRWDRNELQLYERNDDFYLGPAPIRYHIVQLFAGVGTRMYETGQIDLTGVPAYDVERVRDPNEPLNSDLREGVTMCIAYVPFDTSRPPFDDPKVRQAFALAVDREQYNEVVQQGAGIPARGLFPPSLPGHNTGLRGPGFDPELARQRLRESRYGGADKLPPIVFTTGGFGSDAIPMVQALVQMWQANLGVSIEIENVEPDRSLDEIFAGRHGNLVSFRWCADYPDPENFADVLFHTGAEQNIGGYSNRRLDTLLENARVERDVSKRIEAYQEAERIIVEDAAAVFLNHPLSFVLVKPYIKGYEFTPIRTPLERYLWIDPAGLE